jgi:hypothetical protein
MVISQRVRRLPAVQLCLIHTGKARWKNGLFGNGLRRHERTALEKSPLLPLIRM